MFSIMCDFIHLVISVVAPNKTAGAAFDPLENHWRKTRTGRLVEMAKTKCLTNQYSSNHTSVCLAGVFQIGHDLL